MHGPDHPLPAAQNLLQVVEREHGLVGPVQVDDVGLSELGQAGDVVAEARGVDGKEPFAAEAVAHEDFEPFEGELEPAPERGLEVHDVGPSGRQDAVATEQGGLDPFLTQGLEQA